MEKEIKDLRQTQELLVKTITQIDEFNNNVAESIRLFKPIAIDYYKYQNKVKEKAGVDRGVYG